MKRSGAIAAAAGCCGFAAIAAAAGWLASENLGSTPRNLHPTAYATGIQAPGPLAANQAWYTKAVGTLNPAGHGRPAGMPARAARVRRLIFENLRLPGGQDLTRWTPPGQRAPAQGGASEWGLPPRLLARATAAANPRALIAVIHTIPVWRSPNQTFAVISELVSDPLPHTLHSAALAALTLIPGVRTAPGSDYLGRHGRAYTLGDQTLVLNPTTGAELGFHNPVLTGALLTGRVAPRCVRRTRALTVLHGPPWCFDEPEPLHYNRKTVLAAMAAARQRLRAQRARAAKAEGHNA